MGVDYTDEGKCKIIMSSYTQEIIIFFPKRIDGTSATPAADSLFKVGGANEEKKTTRRTSGSIPQDNDTTDFLK